MSVAMLVSSLPNLSEYAPVIPSINTLQEDTATWGNVSVSFVEEEKWPTRSDTRRAGQNDSETLILASSSIVREWQSMIRLMWKVKCYSCNIDGHYINDCKTLPTQSNQIITTQWFGKNWS